MLRLNAGISQKVGDSNYGSHGASVNLEIELESGLIQEPERLQERIRQVFRLAQQAVQEELNKPGTKAACSASDQPSLDGNGQHNGNGTNGHRNGSGQTASQKQMTYAGQLAGQIKGFGVQRLETLAGKMFGKSLAALTSLDASGLIDCLKSIKAGEIDLDAVWGGVTP